MFLSQRCGLRGRGRAIEEIFAQPLVRANESLGRRTNLIQRDFGAPFFRVVRVLWSVWEDIIIGVAFLLQDQYAGDKPEFSLLLDGFR